MSTVYLPVTPRLNLTSEQRAKGISRELYNLKLPKVLHEPGRTTTMLLATIQHPTTGEWACVGDTDLTITVHPLCDITALLDLMHELSFEEKELFRKYINDNKGLAISFNYIIPKDSIVLNTTQAIEAGWIEDQTID